MFSVSVPQSVEESLKKVYYILYKALVSVCILQCRSLPVPLGIFTEIPPILPLILEADEVRLLAFECDIFFS